MNLKFTTEIELNEKTDLQLVKSVIKNKLNKIGADKIETFENIIQFQNLYFLLSGKGKIGTDYMSVVTKGKFAIIDNYKTMIKYESYFSPWIFIIVLLAGIIVGLFAEIGALYAGTFLAGGGLLIAYIKVSSGGNSLLKEIKDLIDKQINKK